MFCHRCLKAESPIGLPQKVSVYSGWFRNLPKWYLWHMSDLPEKLREKMAARAREGNLRTLSVPPYGVDFYSNDYLGLSGEPLAVPKAPEAPGSHPTGHPGEAVASSTESGAHFAGHAPGQIRGDAPSGPDAESPAHGSGGSRLVSGNHPLYAELENTLCRAHRADAALVYNSGYDANIGLLSAVPQRTDYVFYDESVHASIRDGLGLCRARAYSFAHNSLESLSRRVATVLPDGIPSGSEVYVVTETVFSMEGDGPDLAGITAYCRANGFRLILDEAHAVGVLGKHGEGAVAAAGLEDLVFARVVTFGKAIGRHGAAVLCDSELREYLVNFSRSLIYTTALPPRTLESLLEAYALMSGETGNRRRDGLWENIAFFRQQAEALGLDKGFYTAGGPIQTYRVGDSRKAGRLAGRLVEKGFLVKAIRYPTVPRGSECLRFCLHSYNSKDDILSVLSILSEELKMET